MGDEKADAPLKTAREKYSKVGFTTRSGDGLFPGLQWLFAAIGDIILYLEEREKSPVCAYCGRTTVEHFACAECLGNWQPGWKTLAEKTKGEIMKNENEINNAVELPAKLSSNSPVLRCKMQVVEVTHSIGSEGQVEQERVKLTAVYGKDGTANAQWSKWTPNASFEIWINNTHAFGQLSKGFEFFVDFTPVIISE